MVRLVIKDTVEEHSSACRRQSLDSANILNEIRPLFPLNNLETRRPLLLDSICLLTYNSNASQKWIRPQSLRRTNIVCEEEGRHTADVH